MKRRTLRRKLLVWLASYLALLTLVVFSAANYVHERAEHSVWRALLNSELDSVIAHGAALLGSAINRALQPRLSIAQLCWLAG